MGQRLNVYNQPIGEDVPDWKGSIAPDHRVITGQYCKLEALTTVHCTELFTAFSAEGNEGLWTYMPAGPFEKEDDLRDWLETASQSKDPLFYALIDGQSGKAVGFASYLRIAPQDGVIEVGFIAFSPLLQRTRVATEAMFLMMRHVFNDLGNRRYEWKCDALNAKSKAAAKRLGFSYDGLFEQALVYKGRNRDTAWYSVLDKDWPVIEKGYEMWLHENNFDDDGQQIANLGTLFKRSADAHSL